MSKNTEMLKTFFKILRNDEAETNSVIPDMYCCNFHNIETEELIKNGIKNLLIDIDGTILPVDDVYVSLELLRSFGMYQIKDFNICLLSNNNESRVYPVAKELGVKYLCNANKPLPEAYENAMKELKAIDKSTVAMIGDQMLSDIKGANEFGLYTILVQPISKHNNIKTGTQRILQRKIENHLKKRDLFDRNVFYNSRK